MGHRSWVLSPPDWQQWTLLLSTNAGHTAAPLSFSFFVCYDVLPVWISKNPQWMCVIRHRNTPKMPDDYETWQCLAVQFWFRSYSCYRYVFLPNLLAFLHVLSITAMNEAYKFSKGCVRPSWSYDYFGEFWLWNCYRYVFLPIVLAVLQALSITAMNKAYKFSKGCV